MAGAVAELTKQLDDQLAAVAADSAGPPGRRHARTLDSAPRRAGALGAARPTSSARRSRRSTWRSPRTGPWSRRTRRRSKRSGRPHRRRRARRHDTSARGRAGWRSGAGVAEGETSGTRWQVGAEAVPLHLRGRGAVPGEGPDPGRGERCWPRTATAEVEVWPDWATTITTVDPRLDVAVEGVPPAQATPSPSPDASPAGTPAPTPGRSRAAGELRRRHPRRSRDPTPGGGPRHAPGRTRRRRGRRGTGAPACPRWPAGARVTADAEALARIAAANGIDELIIGLPLDMSGSEGAKAADAREWATRRRATDGPARPSARRTTLQPRGRIARRHRPAAAGQEGRPDRTGARPTGRASIARRPQSSSRTSFGRASQGRPASASGCRTGRPHRRTHDDPRWGGAPRRREHGRTAADGAADRYVGASSKPARPSPAPDAARRGAGRDVSGVRDGPAAAATGGIGGHVADS